METKNVKPVGSNKVAVYIPSNIEGKEAITEQKLITKQVQRLFSEQFGGCTTLQGVGSWQGNNNNIVNESVNIIESFVSEINEKIISLVFDEALKIKRAMNQEAVTVIINNSFYLI